MPVWQATAAALFSHGEKHFSDACPEVSPQAGRWYVPDGRGGCEWLAAPGHWGTCPAPCHPGHRHCNTCSHFPAAWSQPLCWTPSWDITVKQRLRRCLCSKRITAAITHGWGTMKLCHLLSKAWSSSLGLSAQNTAQSQIHSESGLIFQFWNYTNFVTVN